MTPHRKRAEVDARHPAHVVMRVTPEVARLRTRKAYQAIRKALQTCAAREDYRVVHISIQSNHVHAIVEADDRKSGTVFACRYHATAITTPRQARNALAYLFNNWRKHRADIGSSSRIDPFSSAWRFDGWETPHGQAPPREPLPVVDAQSWLLREGWARGGTIRFDEVPASA